MAVLLIEVKLEMNNKASWVLMENMDDIEGRKGLKKLSGVSAFMDVYA
jgi:hypothetical protein